MHEIYIGPMSKNVVNGVVDFVKDTNIPIGLIASRRQIDCDGGYVNKWTTATFAKYVKERDDRILICRDHGGIGQGSKQDDGIVSLMEDAKYMDIIHIDPWKKLNYDASVDYTIRMMEKCLSINSKCFFEIGTEESIYTLTPYALDGFLNTIDGKRPALLSKIKYAVIQAGTSLKNGINTGNYDEQRMKLMCDMCLKYGVMSKEHNGDYQTPDMIKYKLSSGLSAINIAPEIAHIETKILLNELSPSSISEWFDLCINDGNWKKWFSDDFDPMSDKHKVLLLCGHYVLTRLYDTILYHDISYTVAEKTRRKVKEFILERIPNRG